MMRTPTWWQAKALPSTLLLPLSALYYVGYRIDRALKKPKRAPLPVIGIGNITAGGAGKTPTAIAVASMLRGMGEVPHIVSRGYGGEAHIAHRVDVQNDSAKKVGDEALLLARHAPTWVGRNRLASAQAAKAAGATIIIADDAMQHHALHKDLLLMVVDTMHGLSNQRLLPAGPLRARLRDIPPDTVIVAVGDAALPAALSRWPAVQATLEPTVDTAFLRDARWLAFAGIAYPQKFYATLRAHGADLAETVDYADHHAFSQHDIEPLLIRAQAKGLKLITTEKDAVRIHSAWRPMVQVLPVQLAFAAPDMVRQLLHARLAQARS